MLVWGPKRRKSKKTLRGRPEIAAGPALAARVLYGRQSGREISETSLGKGKRDFFDLRGLGFGTAKIVSKRENDGSEKNLGRQSFENGRGRRFFAWIGPVWFGRASARFDLRICRRRIF